ncbi:GNAT family N-acetyltransferase [Glaciimonas sp. GG7]
MTALLIRPMTVDDIPVLIQIQMECYPPSMVEPEAILLKRINSSRQTCWLLEYKDIPAAYLFSYPSCKGMVTALNAPFNVAPDPDCLYLHDLAVTPRLRGQCAGQALVTRALAYARSVGLSWSALVAVQGSLPFWAKFGYERHDGLSVEASKNLLSYPIDEGVPAIYMLQHVG